MMKRLLILSLILISIVGGCVAPAAPSKDATAAQAADYEMGDRLFQAPSQSPQSFKEVNWDAFVPATWNPMEVVEQLNLGNVQDSDPRAQQALDRLMAEWNSAPINPAINGASVRIAGFVVPLESIDAMLSEFLLVPYFGACIHVPPPPANQILHVFADEPVADVESMDAVWVNGVVETVSSKTSMGDSGYRMNAVKVEAYEQPPMRLPP